MMNCSWKNLISGGMRHRLTLVCLAGLTLLSTLEALHAADGLLFSVVGYDIGSPMRAMVRGDAVDLLDADATWDVVRADNSVAATGPVAFWGKKWDLHWWVADFTGFAEEGSFSMKIRKADGTLVLESDIPFNVGAYALWNASHYKVAIEQLQQRHALARDGIGWKDCGSDLREANSHCTALIGLHDLLDNAAAHLTPEETTQILEQVVIGTDYIRLTQDRAKAEGFGDGPVVHEIPDHIHVITGDAAKAAVVFAMGSRHLASTDPARSVDYLNRSVKAFNYLKTNGPISAVTGYSAAAHGATGGLPAATQFMTRDLVMMTWAALELVKAGRPEFKADAIEYAGKIMARQIPETKKEGGKYWGHFYEYDSYGGSTPPTYSEKPWIHNAFNYDTGGTFPHYFVIPFVQMYDLWPQEVQRTAWKQSVENFAYHYFLPACRDNPFNLLPTGYFTDQGILNFCGLWHGMNGAYGSAAAIALDLETFLSDPQFREIAIGNLQWICGLNTGFVEANSGQGADNPDLALSGDFTVAFWSNIPAPVNIYDAPIGGSGPINNALDFRYKRMTLFDSSSKLILASDTPMTPGVWEHYALTRSGGNLVLYLNGVEVATGTWNGTFTAYVIGKGYAKGTVGAIDEFYVYTRALIPAEIIALRDNQMVSSTGLAALWKFDETGSVTAVDSSGNGRDAPMIGGATRVSGKYGNALGMGADAMLISASMIQEVGARSRGSWTGIPGTICNGFDADQQFRLYEISTNVDGPNFFTDEDWITHSGGWCSAISRLAVESASVDPPNGPSNLDATAVHHARIELDWQDSSANESGFKIERRQEAGAWGQIAIVGLNVTNYADTSVSAETSYTYRIRAYNLGGDSEYSNEDTATTPAQVNQPPLTDGGGNQSTLLPPGLVNLDGTISDDGLPTGVLTSAWNKISGPGNVTFGNAVSVDTTATFSKAGIYVLRLTGYDGELNASDDVQITVSQKEVVEASRIISFTFGPKSSGYITPETDPVGPSNTVLRVAYWNNGTEVGPSSGATSTTELMNWGISDTVKDSTGATVSGLTGRFVGYERTIRSGSGIIRDGRLWNWGPRFTNRTAGEWSNTSRVTVSNVPYATYDVVVYMWGSDTLVNSARIGSKQEFVRGPTHDPVNFIDEVDSNLGNFAGSGNYIESNYNTPVPLGTTIDISAVTQGHYVCLSGVTGNFFTLEMQHWADSMTNMRGVFGGMQIVESAVPISMQIMLLVR